MNDDEIRAALDRHWATSTGGSQDAEYEMYRDDVIIDYPQSGERIHGKKNIQALRGHHPEKPSGFEVRRTVGSGSLWIIEYVIVYGSRPVYTVSIMEFADDKVAHETQYFADPFSAPAWRAQWVEQVGSKSAAR